MKKKNSCFGVLEFDFKFFKNFKSTTHEPIEQHRLNDEYYDRIEAIQFTMNHGVKFTK